MARQKVKEAKTQFSVMLKPSMVEELDKYADKYSLTRSQLMANLIEGGLDDLRTLDKWGITSTLFHGVNIFKKLREAIFSGKVSIDEKGDITIKK